MTTPSVQLGCPNYSTCHSTALSHVAHKQEIKDLKDRCERSDAQILEFQAAMSMRLESVEIQKRDERIAAGQRNETTLQRSVDRLECENAVLREIMRRKGLDMDEVALKLADIKTPASMLEADPSVVQAFFG